jgi:hypothetical protein
MAYAPKLQTISDHKIIDNILTFVKDDFKSALDYNFPLQAAGMPLLDAAIARPVGTTTLHMDGFTTKPGEGDLFTIAGDAQVYTVISSTALVGTDSDVTFAPGLRVAIPAADGNQVVTFTGLPDFTQRTVGRFFKLGLTTFAIEPDRSGPQQSADGSWVEDTFRVGIFMSVVDADEPTATRKAMKYAATMESLLRNATVAQYTAGITGIFALNVELSYEYGLILKNASTYEKPINMELLLKFNER